jgi:PIN domain nuclease of toxin-antitoxin system
MRLLLDTNALAWVLLETDHLSSRAAALVRDEGNEILVSAASCWEIATKVRRGKWRELEVVERDLLQGFRKANFTVLPIEAEMALRAGRMPGAHKDPFDRMIAAKP